MTGVMVPGKGTPALAMVIGDVRLSTEVARLSTDCDQRGLQVFSHISLHGGRHGMVHLIDIDIQLGRLVNGRARLCNDIQLESKDNQTLGVKTLELRTQYGGEPLCWSLSFRKTRRLTRVEEYVLQITAKGRWAADNGCNQIFVQSHPFRIVGGSKAVKNLTNPVTPFLTGPVLNVWPRHSQILFYIFTGGDVIVDTATLYINYGGAVLSIPLNINLNGPTPVELNTSIIPDNCNSVALFWGYLPSQRIPLGEYSLPSLGITTPHGHQERHQ